MTPIFDFLIRFRLGAIGVFLMVAFGPSLGLPGLELPEGTLVKVSISAVFIYLIFLGATLSAYIAFAPLVSLAASIALMHGLIGIVFDGSQEGVLLAIVCAGFCGIVLSVRGAWRITEGISMGHAARYLMPSIVGDFLIFGAAAYVANLIVLVLLNVMGFLSIIPVLMVGIFAPLSLAISYGFLFPLIAGYEPSEEGLVAHYNRTLRMLDPVSLLAGKVLRPNNLLIAAAFFVVATVALVALVGGKFAEWWLVSLVACLSFGLLAGLLGLSWRAAPPMIVSIGVLMALGMVLGRGYDEQNALIGLMISAAIGAPVVLSVYYEIMGRLKGGDRLEAALDQAGVVLLITAFGSGLALLCAIIPWLWAYDATRDAARLILWMWVFAPFLLLTVGAGVLILLERVFPRRETIRWTV